MASDDEACSTAKKMKIDAPTKPDTVHDINAQFPKIDNLEYFPEKVLFHIFSKVNDNDLLHLSDTSCRFQKIARAVFKEKYADKHFEFDGNRKRQLYEDLFDRFGRSADIKGVEVKRIPRITESHWLPQLLRQYTNHLQKLAFIECAFIQDIHIILSEHMHIEHLVLQSVKTNVEFNLPEYRNLKKLELDVNGYIFDNLEQTIQDNPTLESLILKDSEFTLHDVMKIIAQNSMYLQHLTELQLKLELVNNVRISAAGIDLITETLRNLQSLKLTINDSYLELIQRLGLACKLLKTLSLEYHGGFGFHFGIARSNVLFDALRQFTTLEQFELNQASYNGRIETVVEHMPTLRQLDLFIRNTYMPDSNTIILSLLRNCPSIETITLHTFHDKKPDFFVNALFWDEFNAVMQHSNGKVELKINGKSAGHVTRNEIVWNNAVMHWFEYDWKFNKTNINLLDLAKPSAASVGPEAEQRKPTPFDHILGYLDLASLHAMSAASEHSKQLVEHYVEQHAQQNGTFTISDQFHHDPEGLDAFTWHVENLNVEILYTDLTRHLSAIVKNFSKLCKLSICSKGSLGWLNESCFVFRQVRHLIVDAISLDFCSILQHYPQLETLNIKSKDFFMNCCLEPLANCGLKKFTFEYYDEYTLEQMRKIFKNTSTKLISIKK